MKSIEQKEEEVRVRRSTGKSRKIVVQFPGTKEREKGNRGGVAQLGEHLPCKQGVMGSNPIISTKVREGEGAKPREAFEERKGIGEENRPVAQEVRARA